jgi:3-oxoacyl-[acyl-carrier-protein] synthase III
MNHNRANNLSMADIDLFVPHQANGKLREIAIGMGVSVDR